MKNLTASERIAKMLLEIKAVTLSPKKPYRFVSGIISPIYTDNRLLMGYPLKQKEITIYMAYFMKDNDLNPDIIAGTATAGIPPAAWLSELLNLPMVYVRGEKKGHGKDRQVEGVMKKGDKVLLVEDLISTGKSSLTAIDVIRNEGGKVNTCLAFLDYGFADSRKNYQAKKVTLHALCNLDVLVSVATEMKLISEKEKEMILDWRKDPWGWPKNSKPQKKHQNVDY